MMYSIFILQLIFLFPFMEFIRCECEKTASIDGCCQDQWKQNGTCVDCPPGKIGVGCDSPCPENFYGTLCKLACNCTENQICDKEFGCVEANFSTYGTTTEDVPTFKLSVIYWSSLACFIIVMLIVISAISFLALKRKGSNPESAENDNEHRLNNNSSAEEASISNDNPETNNPYSTLEFESNPYNQLSFRRSDLCRINISMNDPYDSASGIALKLNENREMKTIQSDSSTNVYSLEQPTDLDCNQSNSIKLISE